VNEEVSSRKRFALRCLLPEHSSVGLAQGLMSFSFHKPVCFKRLSFRYKASGYTLQHRSSQLPDGGRWSCTDSRNLAIFRLSDRLGDDNGCFLKVFSKKLASDATVLCLDAWRKNTTDSSMQRKKTVLYFLLVDDSPLGAVTFIGRFG
jgi:hypothetical protein